MSNLALISVLIASIVLVVFCIAKLKIHAFLSLSLASIFVALITGVDLLKIGSIIENGVGGTLGFLAVIIGCGSILGKMLEVSGGAEKIALSLLNLLGKKRADVVMMLVGFIAGIPVFVEVGFVLLVPLVLVVAKEIGVSRIKIGVALATSLMSVHCMVPPHPAATSIVATLGADIGKVILMSIVVGMICAFIGGVLFLKFFVFSQDDEVAIKNEENSTVKNMPSTALTYFTILLPLVLMLLKTLVFKDNAVFAFIGNPIIALLISVFVAYYTLGLKQGYSMQELMEFSSNSFTQIASILLIIGAGGAFNEILIASGIGEALKQVLGSLSLNPVFLAWLIAIILHASVGSATVAMISAAGIVLQIDSNISKEVLCLAIGSGAIGCTIVTDSLFWLVKESLGMSVKAMFKYFTGATLIASICGLILSYVLSIIL
ncbi:TRAP transporter large permease subunit [Campylobacter canadensis]|uniref:GntT/GntP/DsdX family permease n=1 Tax=Campylobacter canadensis TaxID=449520 RepID=UPI001552D506|nr:gluconate:H+ symporter [Campylobacter canadensis]MBZ7994488.1 TRAP transporter large permease subunit [Campylobacter canadensis]MBZ7996425.1 TRAP transporter large permease subunit [Campylobacter canadensis]MBZ8001722.1 TRAP transporter large permease subunit [Campylobacter canadensis]MBZ8002931.1 TRAP transporter large permease subunit [Campylobacter canadensis]